MTTLGFRVRVTDLVFVFRSASLVLKQVSICIRKPLISQLSFYNIVIFSCFRWFLVVLDAFRMFLDHFRSFQIVLGRFRSFQIVLGRFSWLLTLVSTVVCRCFSKQGFLKISENLQERNCVGNSFLVKLQTIRVKQSILLSRSGFSSCEYLSYCIFRSVIQVSIFHLRRYLIFSLFFKI